jgi:hypothetical protein
MLLIDIEMRLQGAGPDAIGAMIDEHVSPLLAKPCATRRDRRIVGARLRRSSLE